MKYEFLLKRNTHMYNHLITCTCGLHKYEAICESAPKTDETIFFWPDEFGVPLEEQETVTKDLIEWAKSQRFKFILCQGKRS